MDKREFVLNVMENDQEGIDEMSIEQAAEILGWMRNDDTENEIPADLTAEEFAEIWNEIKGNNKLWYAIMKDDDDTDWGTGYDSLEEAIERVKDLRIDTYPDAYIAVIDESGNEPMCIEEIRDFD